MRKRGEAGPDHCDGGYISAGFILYGLVRKSVSELCALHLPYKA